MDLLLMIMSHWMCSWAPALVWIIPKWEEGLIYLNVGTVSHTWMQVNDQWTSVCWFVVHFKGSTTHTSLLLIHQCWTPHKARTPICFATGSKYFICPYAHIEWKWTGGQYFSMLILCLCIYSVAELLLGQKHPNGWCSPRYSSSYIQKVTQSGNTG